MWGNAPWGSTPWGGTGVPAAVAALTPAAGHIAATGSAPVVTQAHTVAPAAAHALAAGKAPTVTQPRAVTPAAAHAVVAGKAPTILQAVGVYPAVGHVAAGGHAPVLSQSQTVAPSAAQIIVGGYTPTLVGVLRWPDPATVLAGIAYGPTGANYTGTLVLCADANSVAAAVWAYVMSNGQTAESAIVDADARIDELHLIHGLRLGNPLSVTVDTRLAGAVAQTISDVAGTVTVSRAP